MVILTFLWGLIIYLWTFRQGWINHLWYIGALICIYVFLPVFKSVFDTNRKYFYYITIIIALFTFGNTTINIIVTIVIGGV